MTKLFKLLFGSLKSERDIRDEYFSSAVSLQDLERRQRQVDRGQAPWQVKANENLKGWI